MALLCSYSLKNSLIDAIIKTEYQGQVGMTEDRMTDNEKRYWTYFINSKGAIEYYSKCLGCDKKYKHSYRI